MSAFVGMTTVYRTLIYVTLYLRWVAAQKDVPNPPYANSDTLS